MLSNAKVCWCELRQRCRNSKASERHRVPSDCGQRDLVLAVHRSINPAAQPARAADAASGERDRANFDSWIRPKVVSIYKAARLTRNTLGRQPQRLSQQHCLVVVYFRSAS